MEKRTFPAGLSGWNIRSLVDELLSRFLDAFPETRAAVLCVDPSQRLTGGALLGDRLRVNAAGSDRVFFRSLATRRAHASLSAAVADGCRLLQAAGFDLVFLETAGIGQSDTEVADICDLSLYVMTPEFGAPSQLEKIGMLDFADFVVLNKFDRQGAEDALREVRRAMRSDRRAFSLKPEAMPVFPACAHRFRVPGVNALFNALFARIGSPGNAASGGGQGKAWDFPPLPAGVPVRSGLLPPESAGYLRRIAAAVSAYHGETAAQAAQARRAEHLYHALGELGAVLPPKAEAFDGRAEEASGKGKPARENPALRVRYQEALAAIDPDVLQGLRSFDSLRKAYAADTQSYRVREKDFDARNHTGSLSGLEIPKVSLPMAEGWGDQVEFLRSENAGVSVCCLDDAKRLYSGFDLCAPATSVSMTINGPAPVILAYYFNAAVDAACERWLKASGDWEGTRIRVDSWFRDRGLIRPVYRAEGLPEGHDGSGLGFLRPAGSDHGTADLIRSSADEKGSQVRQVEDYRARFPAESAAALESLKDAARKGGNLFGELMEAGKYCTLGTISQALFAAGGAYRRNA